jgi:hypothetical protein
LSSNPLRLVNCDCITGFYYNTDDSCLQCPDTCIDCIISNCITCAANRVYSGSGRDCTCTGVGFDHYPNTLWCSDCFNVFFTPLFSSDLTLLNLNFYIDIEANTSTLRTNLNIFRNTNCQSLFQETTLGFLGTQP